MAVKYFDAAVGVEIPRRIQAFASVLGQAAKSREIDPERPLLQLPITLV
ncbi:hypothetical protein [Accumulibacter sp.]|nr:hypothetical protein [Accumulibacter sp.]